MDNNINFTGAYLINYKKAIPNLQAGFERAIGDHKRQIFRNYAGDKDTVLYVLKNSKDYDAAHFIHKNEMKFQYMPDVDTKLQFDERKPEEPVKYLQENTPKVITKMKELVKFVEENRLKNRAVKDSHLSLVDKILNNIGVKPKVKAQFFDKTGVIKFIDKNAGGEIIISPKGQNSISYVYYKPFNKYDLPTMFAVDKQGKKIAVFEDADEILQFRKNFNNAIKQYSHNKAAQAK